MINRTFNVRPHLDAGFSVILKQALVVILLSTMARGDAQAALSLTHSWSTNPKPAVAISEALSSLAGKSVNSPRLIIVYFTDSIDAQEIVRQTHLKYPSTQIFGQSVYRGVFTTDGVHIGANGSLAMLAFEGSDFQVGVAGREISETQKPKEMAVESIKQAVSQAGHKLSERPSIVLLAEKKGSEDDVILGLSEALPQHAPLVGGTSTTNSFATGTVIANDKVYSHGVVTAVLYTPRPIGSSYISGFAGVKKSGVATAVEGRVLKEIDGRSAQAVYKEWAAGRFDHIQPKGEDILTLETSAAPFAKKIILADGQERLVTVRPQNFLANGGLLLGANIKKGETLYYTEGSQQALVQRAGGVARKAMIDGNLKLANVIGGLSISCAGAATVIGLDTGGKIGEMVDGLIRSMNGKSFIGGFVSSEQGEIPGYGFFSGNLMSSMVVFAK